MKPILITSGEPAGIGPDLCLALAGFSEPLVVIGDKDLLITRSLTLNLNIVFDDYVVGKQPSLLKNHLTVLSIPCNEAPISGVLNPQNSSYVLKMLEEATKRCVSGEFSALVTAPVHKSVINDAGFDFSGHTEFLAEYCKVKTVVMMLASEIMRVALVTTHLPLKDVPKTITRALLTDVLIELNKSLKQNFGIKLPKIYVAGLNPHAGEGGYLGREEIEIIAPVLSKLKAEGLDLHGPFPADTMFTLKETKPCDVFVAMYHDQGLSVLKYASFGQAVNITLGLPIIRTSVDHGTALNLAGKGIASAESLFAAVKMASCMVKSKSCV